jgi:hypothetical protein
MLKPRTPSAAAAALQRVARVWSLVPVVFVLMILIGGIGEPTPEPVTTEDIVLLTIFPFGASVGLVLAWWYPLVGSLMALACLLVFPNGFLMLLNPFALLGWGVPAALRLTALGITARARRARGAAG